MMLRFCLVLLTLFNLAPAKAETPATLLVATTTSTEDSGLLDYLAPMMQDDLGFVPRFIITGSGKALRLGINRDVDVVWVHDTLGEAAFMDQGHGSRHESIMYNRFVLAGPADDPAGIADAPDILTALARIEASGSLFASRGDDSGTHRRELDLWRAYNPQHPILQKTPLGWYRELGVGMGALLNAAMSMKAYILIDEATLLKRTLSPHYRKLFGNDTRLHNRYGAMIVGHTRRTNATLAAEKFVDWLISKATQERINRYRINAQQGFYALRLSEG